MYRPLPPSFDARPLGSSKNSKWLNTHSPRSHVIVMEGGLCIDVTRVETARYIDVHALLSMG
jgi:hypothetical protein